MELHTAQVLSLTLYKLTSLFTGLCLCYMGYRLFLAGIWGSAGDAKGEFGDIRIVIKRAAPGTFFVLMGAIVLGLTIFKGLNLEALQNIPSEVSHEKPPLID